MVHVLDAGLPLSNALPWKAYFRVSCRSTVVAEVWSDTHDRRQWTELWDIVTTHAKSKKSITASLVLATTRHAPIMVDAHSTHRDLKTWKPLLSDEKPLRVLRGLSRNIIVLGYSVTHGLS